MDEERRERGRESLKFRFEFFKQISTLSAAVSVVVVALYRDVALDFPVVVAALVAFGLSVLVAVVGTLLSTMSADISPDIPDWVDIGLSIICALAFGFGGGILLFGAVFPA